MLANVTRFDKNIKKPLEALAYATDIDVVEENLGNALVYAKQHGMDEGSTSLFYESPETDVAQWFNRLDDVYRELIDVDPAQEELVLMKVRTVVFGTSEQVQYPFGIEYHPHAREFALNVVVASIAAMIGLCVITLMGKKP